MDKPLAGVRVLEIAQFTFVPSAGAILADWGADVIKVENPVTGDALRTLFTASQGQSSEQSDSFTPHMEAPNRGKRSIGLGLTSPLARPILEELVRRSDVVLTNYLPVVRSKLRIDVDDIRRINPDIIYVVGTGYGGHGPGRNRPGYDATAFWARGGSADGATPCLADRPTYMPTGAYGDNIGGLAIAGGVAAALFRRQMSGQPSVIDVSLLGVGAWATQFDVNMALMSGGHLPKVELDTPFPGNPLVASYRTSDGRFIQLAMLDPVAYWSEFCTCMGGLEAAADARFATMDGIAENIDQACRIVADLIGRLPLDECERRLNGCSGAWAVWQDSWDLANDEDLVANGGVVEVVDALGVRRKLVASPVRFDTPTVPSKRAPKFAEHTDAILREIGVDDVTFGELKVEGVIA
ncbi:CoA transferase [Mycolicibacterium anyangense]|uniref:CoA transferase n=1 Tax=Mycolicibacterium anyangense TaxID=1431246 RepID=A0A6N4WF10_9MYCO|nr:CoA transferase [Mycolicibacterium anyangense]BBZ78757.1 CoA transferase [Mycolicibacterium anyangense]